MALLLIKETNKTEKYYLTVMVKLDKVFLENCFPSRFGCGVQQ